MLRIRDRMVRLKGGNKFRSQPLLATLRPLRYREWQKSAKPPENLALALDKSPVPLALGSGLY